MELDILRGFLLLWMTLTHMPTWASNLSNQTFGFVSGAEGFIFLAAFMVGQIQFRAAKKRGERGALIDIGKRTLRVYLYHCGLLAVAFTLVALIGVEFHREALRNLLSYYLQSPRQAIIAAVLLQYRPSLLDILPMYVVFMALTPVGAESGQPLVVGACPLCELFDLDRRSIWTQGLDLPARQPYGIQGAGELDRRF